MEMSSMETCFSNVEFWVCSQILVAKMGYFFQPPNPCFSKKKRITLKLTQGLKKITNTLIISLWEMSDWVTFHIGAERSLLAGDCWPLWHMSTWGLWHRGHPAVHGQGARCDLLPPPSRSLHTQENRSICGNFFPGTFCHCWLRA